MNRRQLAIQSVPRSRWPGSLALGFLSFVLTACASGRDDAAVERPFTGTTLRVAAIEHPVLARALAGLRGEWHAQTGGTLVIEGHTSPASLAKAGTKADVVIYPARLVRELADGELIAPLSNKALENPALAWSDVFEALRLHEATWNERTYGVPLGAGVLVCLCRDEQLKRLGVDPPQTWNDFSRLIARLEQTSRGGDAVEGRNQEPACEPLGEGWAALTFLSRAAAYARHRDHYSTLFDIDSFEPLIERPPFVRALEELVAAHSAGAASPSLALSPSDACRAFCRGDFDLALATVQRGNTMGEQASASDGRPAAAATGSPSAGGAVIVELPGSAEVFDPNAAAWRPRLDGESTRVPLLDGSGLLASITRQCQLEAAARQFLALLASPEISRQIIAPAGGTPFRSTQQSDAAAWIAPCLDDADGAFRAIESALARTPAVLIPPVVGCERYLAALDEAVRAAVMRSVAPHEALTRCAAQWRQITADAGGVEQQRASYRRSLNLGP